MTLKNVDYLQELRRRLIGCLIFIGSLFVIFAYFAADLYHVIALPLITHFTGKQQLIATQLTTPLIAPLKFALLCAIFLGIPFIFWQLWRFVAPALYARERKQFWPYALLSVGLFYSGVAFAYFISLPLTLKFLLAFTPKDVTVLPDMGHYLDFVLSLLFAFGLAFEVPLLTIAVVSIGLLSVATLQRARRYVIVLAFIVGMILTPPDVISQITLALPLWGLFELGLLLARRLERPVTPGSR